MNKKNIFSLLLGAMVLLFAACEPIEDRKELSNSFNPDNIELEVVQSTPGGNGLSIRMKTSGVTGYWDYNIDQKFTDRVEVNYPIPGKSTFTYHVSTAYMPNGNPSDTEYISKSIDVQIDVLDQPLPQAYYDLVGDDLSGKSWVFHKANPWEGGGGPVWWAMSDPGNYEAIWWNAGATCCPPGDANGKMHFDLNGAANYTYYTSMDGDGALGSFSFNADYSALTFKTQPILGYDADRVNPDSKYKIIKLTKDEMVLFTDTNGGGTGWVWVFIPAE
ncbi:hypothetical protein [Carboxylicivirga sp. N1Y90]|uniref:hypothetical protein n=1 Tax=Carboxylicivirga fragile TaxID=3417571 RepID=UPI003D33CB54|nr:hypothetical protein [Marinilabiliaceae bacterium N1Y90]